MNEQLRSEALSLGPRSNVSRSIAMGSEQQKHRILYPIIPSEGNSSGRVKWIGLHPQEMIDQILLMTKHSSHARFAANSTNALSKKRVAATTQPRWSDVDARCEYLVRSILDERNKATNDHLLIHGQSLQPFSFLINASSNHQQVLRVANDFEAIATKTVLPSYRRVMEAFRSKMAAVATNAKDSNADHVIGETICQIEALMEMVLSARAGYAPASSTKAIATEPSSDKEKNALFQAKMNVWLIQNWTNPFPDTAELNYLATQLIQVQCIVVKAKDAQVNCGRSYDDWQSFMMNIAIKRVETYLVNTRLRKWRKSIEDAFDLRRPAKFLLEDSLRLCEGKALRPIEGWNPAGLSSHPRYSLPLKAWKVKKVTKKRSAKGTEAVKAETWHVTPKRQRVASPKELSAGCGLIELAKGLRTLTCETKTSPSDVVVQVGGMGLSPFNIGASPGLEEDARNKMKEGTFFI